MQAKLFKNWVGFYFGLILLIIIVLIKAATYYPAWIEEVYSTRIYPHISQFHRLAFGAFSISVGDLLYLGAIIYICVKLFWLLRIVQERQWHRLRISAGYARPIFILAGIYIVFNLSWGLNYNRLGIAHQLTLQPKQHTTEDLKTIAGDLVKSMNEKRLLLERLPRKYPPYQEVFQKSTAAFKVASQDFPFFKYENESVKRSIYGRAGIYLGFLGYFNPFTGESQLNLTQPRFLLPFVTCHEIAHQLGYASESEANFVGYLVASNAPDPLFQYSAYFDMFAYVNKELFKLDSTVAKLNLANLNHLVKKDLEEVKEYYKKSNNPFETVVRGFYDHYLKANQQEKGLHSYNEVVGWLVAYYKKSGGL